MTKHLPKTPAVAVHRVEVRLKPEFADAEGSRAMAVLQSLGVPGLREVRASRVYEIRAPYSHTQITQASKELLCDPITQEWRLLSPAAGANGMTHWRVEVWLRETVTDPVGQTVAAALGEMGLTPPEVVRAGSAYRVAGRCAKSQLEKAVPRGLANPLIHTITVNETHP